MIWNRAFRPVEMRGFEPLTPSMRTKCATGLRYIPKTWTRLANFRGHSRHPARGLSVADRAAGRLGVLVEELVAVGGQVDDLRHGSLGLQLEGRRRRLRARLARSARA